MTLSIVIHCALTALCLENDSRHNIKQNVSTKIVENLILYNNKKTSTIKPTCNQKFAINL